MKCLLATLPSLIATPLVSMRRSFLTRWVKISVARILVIWGLLGHDYLKLIILISIPQGCLASKSSRPLGQKSSQPALSAGEEDGDVEDLGDDGYDDVEDLGDDMVMMMNDDDQAFCDDDGAVTPLVTK